MKGRDPVKTSVDTKQKPDAFHRESSMGLPGMVANIDLLAEGVKREIELALQLATYKFIALSKFMPFGPPISAPAKKMPVAPESAFRTDNVDRHIET